MEKEREEAEEARTTLLEIVMVMWMAVRPDFDEHEIPSGFQSTDPCMIVVCIVLHLAFSWGRLMGNWYEFWDCTDFCGWVYLITSRTK